MSRASVNDLVWSIFVFFLMIVSAYFGFCFGSRPVYRGDAAFYYANGYQSRIDYEHGIGARISQ